MFYRHGQLLAFLLFTLANLVTFGNLSPLVTVSVIIMKSRRILAVNHHDGRGFFLPGGLMKAGESLEKAIKREIREETGLTIRLGRFVGLYERPTGKWFHIPTLTFAYVGQIIRGKPKDSLEGTVSWVNPNEIKEEQNIIADFSRK